MSDLTDIYPPDIYGPNGARYYGGGSSTPRERQQDVSVIALLNRVKGKPDAKVTVYRAIPAHREPYPADSGARAGAGAVVAAAAGRRRVTAGVGKANGSRKCADDELRVPTINLQFGFWIWRARRKSAFACPAKGLVTRCPD